MGTYGEGRRREDLFCLRSRYAEVLRGRRARGGFRLWTYSCATLTGREQGIDCKERVTIKWFWRIIRDNPIEASSEAVTDTKHKKILEHIQLSSNKKQMVTFYYTTWYVFEIECFIFNGKHHNSNRKYWTQ